jgi:hypothetical protein
MKLRCLQFSLRTLLIGVTLLSGACAYVGWQAKIVRARNAFRGSPPSEIALCNADARNWPFVFGDDWQPTKVSWLRKLLGDETALFVIATPDTNADDVQTAKALFPEARCVYWERGGRWEPAADETSPATHP